MKMVDHHPVASAIVAGLTVCALFEVIPDRGVSVLVTMGVVTVAGLIRGPRLPLFVRVLFTVLIFYFASGACLVGRTMEPGLTPYTLRMALTFFGILALWPAVSLFRLWQDRIRVVLVVLVLPVALSLACLAAATEEYIFIRTHQHSGVAYAERWTVSNHWLSYDANTKTLRGSD